MRPLKEAKSDPWIYWQNITWTTFVTLPYLNFLLVTLFELIIIASHSRSYLNRSQYFSPITRRATSRGGRGLPCPFLKKVPWFWEKKVLIVSIFGLNILSKRLQNFPCRTFFLVFLTKFLLKSPNSVKLPLPWKISGYAPDNTLYQLKVTGTLVW